MKAKKNTEYLRHLDRSYVQLMKGDVIVKSLDEIQGAGHRIVQGGSYYDQSVVVDDSVVDRVRELSELAPLHNPAHLVCYEAFKHALPSIGHVFVFDTAFHQTMDESKYLYALPYDWNEKYNVRKFGAHGTSHKYVSMRANELLGRTDTKLITCHLGSGASISAVLNGKCVNTSMGLTPNAGLI